MDGGGIEHREVVVALMLVVGATTGTPPNVARREGGTEAQSEARHQRLWVKVARPRRHWRAGRPVADEVTAFGPSLAVPGRGASSSESSAPRRLPLAAALPPVCGPPRGACARSCRIPGAS